MIFTTIQSEAEGATKQLGLFKKSFSSIAADLKKKQGIAFSLGFSNSTLGKADINALRAFNNDLSNGIKSGKAWSTNIKGMSSTVKQSAIEVVKFNKSNGQAGKSLEQVIAQSKKANIGLSNFALTVKSIALNMVAMGLITGAIKFIRWGFDKLNVTVEESKQKYDELNSKLSEFNSEYDTLVEKTKSGDTLTDEEEKRLVYLKDRIKLEKELLDIQKHKIYQEELDTGWTATFDKDSQLTKLSKVDDYIPKNISSSAFSETTDTSSIFGKGAKIDNLLDALDEQNEKIATQKKNLSELTVRTNEYVKASNAIVSVESDRNNNLAELNTQFETAKTNLANYQSEYDNLQNMIDSGTLTDSEIIKAKGFQRAWKTKIDAVNGYIEKMRKAQLASNGVVDALDNSLANVSANELKDSFSADELVLLYSVDIDENATIEDLQSLLAKLKKEAEENPIEINFASSTKQILTNITALSDGFDKLDKIMADISNGETFDYSALVNEDFVKTFGKYAAEYENFLDVVSSSPEDLEKCKSAFNSLVGAWLLSDDALSDLSADTLDLATKMLKEKGIANASEVVHAAYASQLADTAIATGEVTDETMEYIQKLYDESDGADYAKNAMYLLQSQMIAVNNQQLDFTSQINSLYDLANTAGVASGAIASLYGGIVGNGTAAQQLLKSGQAKTIEEANQKVAQLYTKQIQDKIKENQAKIRQALPEYIGGADTEKARSGSSSKNSESYWDTLQEYIDDKKSAVEKLTKENEELNSQYEEAIRIGDQKLADKLFKDILSNSDRMRQAYAEGASEIRDKMQIDVLPFIFEIAPQLKDVPVDEWSEQLLKELDNTLDENVKDKFDSYVSAAQNAYALVGSVSGEGEWAKAYSNVNKEIDDTTKSFYEDTFKLIDKEISKNEDLLSSIKDRISAYDNKMSIIETQQETYGQSKERAIAYYDASLSKMAEYSTKNNAVTKQLISNENALALAKQKLAAIDPADPRFKGTYAYLEEQIESYSKAIRDNKSALLSNKKEQEDYYNSVVSQIESNLSEIYGLEQDRASKALNERQEKATKALEEERDAATKASDDIVDGLEKQLEALEKKNDEMAKTNNLLDLQLERQKALRDKSYSYIDETTGEEILTYDREKVKDLEKQILDEQASQAQEKQAEILENLIDKQEKITSDLNDEYDKRLEALEKKQEEEQEVFDTYWEKRLSSYSLHLEAYNLAQKYGYQEALQGTQQYLYDINQSLYEENDDMYSAGLSLTQSLADGMFTNLETFLGKFRETLINGISGTEAETTVNASISGKDRIDLIKAMKTNSEYYGKANTQTSRDGLSEINRAYGEALGAFFDTASGKWYTDSSKTSLLYDELKNSVNSTLPYIEENKNSTLYNAAESAKNTEAEKRNTEAANKLKISSDKNTTTISDGTNAIRVSTSELIDSNLMLGDTMYSSVEELISALDNMSIGYGLLEEQALKKSAQGERQSWGDSVHTGGGYGYYDKGGVFHVTSDKSTAEKYSKDGSIVDYKGSYSGGYAVTKDEDGNYQQVIAYNDGTQYTNGNKGDGKPDLFKDSEIVKATNELDKKITTSALETWKNTIAQKSQKAAVSDNTNQIYASSLNLDANTTSVVTGMAALPGSVGEAMTSAFSSLSFVSSKSSSGSSSGGKGSIGSSSSISSNAIGSSIGAAIGGLVGGLTGGGASASIGSSIGSAIGNAISKKKKHDGIKSGLVGDNQTFSDKEKLLQAVALDKLNPNESSIIALDNEAVLTQEQIGNVSGTLASQQTRLEVFSGLLESLNPFEKYGNIIEPNSLSPLIRPQTPVQPINQSTTMNFYGMTVKSDNLDQFIEEIKFKTRLR